MFEIYIEDVETYDSQKNEFNVIKGGLFRFSHNLIAISNWEAEFKTPFLTSNLGEKELKSYFLHMCVDEGLTISHLNGKVYEELVDYIGDSKTATVIASSGGSKLGGIRSITSEYIYSMMINAGIPFEAEKWNINRLLVLLEIIAIQSQPEKKMTPEEIYKQNIKLNEERKKKYNTKG